MDESIGPVWAKGRHFSPSLPNRRQNYPQKEPTKYTKEPR